MANNDDYQRDDPNQWQQPGPPDQDLSAQSDAPYGLAGQGQMGDAMSRDVDPNMAGQMDQDPYQQGNIGQQNITPAQGAPMQPNVDDPGMMGNARQQAEQQAENLEDQAQGRSGGLMDKLGNIFGRHGDQENSPDQGNR